MTSPSAVLDLIRRNHPPQPRAAVVTAATAGPPMTVMVRFAEGGAEVQPVILGGQSTVPAVGDRALVMPAQGTGAWVYLGTWSTQEAGADYQTATRYLRHNWRKYQDVDSGDWTFQYDHWTSQYPNTRGAVAQGYWPPQQGAAGDPVPTNPPLLNYVHILDHDLAGALATIAAGSGTVHMVELIMTRTSTAGADYVSPVMHGHLYNGSNPPTEGVAPSWVPGYEARLAPFALGQSARWVLPASWVTAAATGEITGIGFESPSTRDRFEAATDETNARLMITFTAPTEVPL